GVEASGGVQQLVGRGQRLPLHRLDARHFVMTLSGIGIWSFELRHYDAGEVAEAVSELETLGCAAVWIPDIGGEVMEALERLLAPTTTMTIATGVLNVWMHDAQEIAKRWSSWSDAWKD